METVEQHRPQKNHRKRLFVIVFVLFTLSGLVEEFLCAKSFFFWKKKRTEDFVFGCRHQRSDLKPKNFSAKINKKKRSEAKSNCMQIKQRDKRHGTHIKAASDHNVVPCRIPFFLAFRTVPSKCPTVEENPNISLNLMCSFSCGFPFLPSLLGSRLSAFQQRWPRLQPCVSLTCIFCGICAQNTKDKIGSPQLRRLA